MNESEFERLARDAAAGVRAQADMIADSDGALAQLLAAEARATQDGGHTTASARVDTDGERGGRSPWVPLLIAAASIAAVGGIVLVVRGDSPDSIVSTSEPDAPAPSEVDVVPDTAPAATEQTGTVEATTTVPSDTTVAPPDDLVVAVPDEYGPQLTRTVLATYGRGDGPDDLGFMSCQECEPLRPFAPVVTDDGTIFVADADNERWQIFSDGAWTSLPYRPGEVVTASPVIGLDGLIYASVADDLPGRSGLRIVSYDPGTMDVVATHPGGNSMYSTVDLVNDAIEMGGQRIHTLEYPLGMPTWDVDWETGLVTLSLSGIQRQFQLPPGWRTNEIEVKALEDGSIVLRVYVLAADSESLDWLLVRLWPDGTSCHRHDRHQPRYHQSSMAALPTPATCSWRTQSSSTRSRRSPGSTRSLDGMCRPSRHPTWRRCLACSHSSRSPASCRRFVPSTPTHPTSRPATPRHGCAPTSRERWTRSHRSRHGSSRGCRPTRRPPMPRSPGGPARTSPSPCHPSRSSTCTARRDR